MRVQVGELAQGQGRCLDDQIVDADLVFLVGKFVHPLAQIEQGRDVDIAGHVKMRDLLLTLDHALPDAPPQFADIQHLHVRAGWNLAKGGAGHGGRIGAVACLAGAAAGWLSTGAAGASPTGKSSTSRRTIRPPGPLPFT